MYPIRRYLLIGLLFLCGPAWAVDCAPDTIILSSQAEVDSFQDVYGPGCDTIVSGLTIEGATITDLTPLAELTTVSTVGPFGFATRLQISSTSLVSLTGLEQLANVYWFELNNNTLLTDLTALSNLVNVQGPLLVNGNTALTNLDGLESLTALPGGALFIENNALLTDLGGVSSINSINGSLVVDNNDSLLNLDDLSGLSVVPFNISVSQNALLNNINGLGGLTDFTAILYLRSNNQLSSLGDLSNFSDLNGLIVWGNPMLTNLDGLLNLTNVTNVNNNGGLQLSFNNTLSNIEGLSNLVAVGADVEISNNPMLDDCSALETLLNSVDDAEPGPGPGVAGVPDVGGNVVLADNLPGCNSLPEPVVGTFAYGGFGTGRPHLLFKGLNIALNCFDTPSKIPFGDTVDANRLQFACSAIPFVNTDTLVYDVAAESCKTYPDFAVGTDLLINAVYLASGNTGATLQQQSDAVFQLDESALLVFDPQTGELRGGESMVCAQPGPSQRVFKDGFE